MKNTTYIAPSLLGASPSPLRSRAWALLLTAAAILPLLLSTASSSFAGSATWLASPTTGDWTNPANWTAGGPPNGPLDTATFATSNITGVFPFNTEVNGIVFNAGASAFTITVNPGFEQNNTLTISGVGITNNSAIAQNFVTTSNYFGNITSLGIITFINSATAGNGTFTNNTGARFGGVTQFFASSTAGAATLIATVGLIAGGLIEFLDDSTGGTARVEVFGAGFGAGRLDISGHNPPGVTTGSIEGNGSVFLGANKLTVGSNNLSTTFSGKIQDGGSLTKIGKGELTLSNASTYTGGTTLTKGTLLVTNTTGSGTGTGAVQINKGTLGGTGIITGAVTVGTGTGTSSGAILLAGNNATSPGTLTINNTLTFNSLSTYKCVLNRITLIAGKAAALGVTINSNVPFTFVDPGTGTLMVGTVFTVINNTSANPIFGTFSNLADGSVFTSNGNNFQASYTGGTGNDLTLTVVP
jgi:autotransporter-associated beta strand protein